MVEINLEAVKNTDVAKTLGVSEGTVRNRKNLDFAEYNKMLIETKLRVLPFLTKDEYISHYGKSIEDVEDKISQKLIPSLLQIKKDYRGNVKDEFIFVPYNSDEICELREDYRELNKCSVISVANRKGGVAKTTNSINIATMLSFIGFNVLLVDYDTQANASQNLKLRPNFEIKESVIDLVLKVGCGADVDIVKENIHHLQGRLKTIGKFDVLPNAGDKETQNKAKNIATDLQMYSTSYKALDMVIESVKDDYDFVIVDTPPNDGDSLRMIALATDYFLFSYKADKRSLEGIEMLFAQLKEEFELPYKMAKKDTIKIIGGIISDYDNKIIIQQDTAKEIEDGFSYYAGKYNLPKDWQIFRQRIAHLQKFSKIQEKMAYGSLISPFSLSDKLTFREQKAIRDYLDVAIQLVDRIVIDLYSKEEIL